MVFKMENLLTHTAVKKVTLYSQEIQHIAELLSIFFTGSGIV